MQVKRYIGKDAKEAMNKVRMELGQDAIILHTRKIRKPGMAGLFAKPLVEMVVAVNIPQPELRPLVKEPPKPDPIALEEQKRIKSLEEKYNLLDKMLKEYLLRSKSGETGGVAVYSEPVLRVLELMLKSDVEDTHARQIVDVLNSLIDSEDSADTVMNTALQLLEQHLGKPAPIVLKPRERKTVIFIGPTGIGKTTTLAKLAAIYTIQYGKKVGLITADTYRIGAAEQLKVYADLLNIPLQVVYSAEELEGVLEGYVDMDLVLLDTAGKSTRDLEHPEEIIELMDRSGAKEALLVISTTTSYNSCLRILDHYKTIPNMKLIFSKIDEADSYGLILNVRMTVDKPLAYLTNGQNVPDDILVANPRTISEWILGLKKAL